MGRRCIIKSCPNSKGSPKDTIHCFPKSNPFQYRRWIEFVDLATKVDHSCLNTEHYGLCARHFSSEAYHFDNTELNGKSSDRKKLKAAAFPTWFGKDDNIATSIQRNDSLPPEHNYCKSVNNQMLLEIEIESLKISLEQTLKQIDEKDTIIKKLRQSLYSCQAKCQQLEDKLCHVISAPEEKVLLEKVKKILTPSQIRILSHPEHHFVMWSQQERAQLIALHSISSRAYNYLKDKMQYPLASESTIRRWIREAEVVPDKLIVPVLNILEAFFLEAPPYLRQCGIAFDEMSIDSKYCYDPREDKVYGKEKTVTVITARGLLSSWKQVVYFTFNSYISKNLLDEIIRALHKVGANVKSLTTDMGPKNQRLWKEFGAGIVKDGKVLGSSFDNVVSKERIRIFPDLPHLIKLFRNHVLDDGITFSDGVVLDRCLFLELLRKQKCEFKLTHELSHKHVYVKGKQRQAVKPAFQLFSNRVAQAILFTSPENVTRKNQASKIKFFNDFADLANTRSPAIGNNPFQSPYGTFSNEQDQLLKQAHLEFSLMVVGKRKRKTLAPFQKGLLMYIQSMQGLLQDLEMPPVNAKYLMTARLNQDLLENAFSRIRGFGQFNMNPTAIECIYRIRKLILSWNFSDSKACSVQFEDDSAAAIHPIFASKEKIETTDEYLATPFSAEITEKLSKIDDNFQLVILHESNYGIEDRCEEGGMEYVCGYIASKFKEVFPQLNSASVGEANHFWVARVSNGGLTEPSVYWLSLFKKFEEFFTIVHPTTEVNMARSCCKNLQDVLNSRYPDVPLDVIKFYVRTRIHMRIKSLNKREEDEAFKRQARRHGIVTPTQNELLPKSENLDEETSSELSDEAEIVIDALNKIFL